MDPDTIRSLRSRIRMDLLPSGEDGSMIPVDLSAICEGWIYIIGTDPGSRPLGSVFGIQEHFGLDRQGPPLAIGGPV